MATLNGASKTDMFLCPTNVLTLVTDTTHELYDPRVEFDVDENLVKNIMVHGVIEPVVVRNAGNGVYEVVDGRQRYKAVCEANRRLEAEGKEAIRVPAILRRGSTSDLFGVSVSANECRKSDELLMKADKANKLLNMGKTVEEVAIINGVTIQAVGMWLQLTNLSPKLRAAVEAGVIKPTAAAMLANLTHEKQDEVLEQILASGKKPTAQRCKKAAADEVATEDKPAKDVEVNVRMRTKKEIELLLAEYESDDSPSEFSEGYKAALAWVLKKPLEN